MQKTPKLTLVLQGISLLSALSIFAFVWAGHNGPRGIYTYTVVGAFYELLWFPSLATLVGIPFVGVVLVLRQKLAWKHLIIPLLLAVGTFTYLLLFQ